MEEKSTSFYSAREEYANFATSELDQFIHGSFISIFVFVFSGNNSTETKLIFLYIGCQLISKTLKIIMNFFYHMNIKHVHRFFIKTQTAFRDCRVRFSLFLDNLSRNSCILGLQPRDKAAMLVVNTKEYFSAKFASK